MDRLGWGIVAFALVCPTPVTAQCDEMPAAQMPARGSSAVAMVVATDGPLSVIGALTLIDAPRRLFLTASHVARGETVHFRFPSLDGPRIRTGKVLLRIPEADGLHEANGKAWGQARDVALVVADAPLPQLPAAQLRARARSDVSVAFYGFPAGFQDPTLGTGQAATPQTDPRDGFAPVDRAQARCTRAIRATTLGGDSGSAILDADGYVIGITSQGVLEGRMNLFVRSDCFFREVIDKAPEGNSELLYHLLRDGRPEEITAKLALDPSLSGFGNIDLYRAAIRFARDIADGNLGAPGQVMRERALNVLSCPIINYMHERGLPMETLTHVLANSLRGPAVADRLAMISIGVTSGQDVASDRLSVAVGIYGTLLKDRIDEVATVADAKRLFTPSDAVLLKSFADASIRLSTESEEASDLLIQADRAAGVAAIVADSPAVRSAALLSVADASRRMLDYRRAAGAIQRARLEGRVPTSALASQKYLQALTGQNVVRALSISELMSASPH